MGEVAWSQRWWKYMVELERAKEEPGMVFHSLMQDVCVFIV